MIDLFLKNLNLKTVMFKEIISIWIFVMLTHRYRLLWKVAYIFKSGLTLKGVFAKNVRGYTLNAIKKRFWSLLILLLSIASIRRKLLKTINSEERSVIQIQKDAATFNSDRKQLFFDAFVNSWYFIIFCIFHDLRVTFENIYSCFENVW